MKERGKRVLAVVIIVAFMLGIVQPFAPSTMGQTSSLTVNNSYWLRLAKNAWNYFQPGVSVDPTTGLHSAGFGYSYFTDWDLGMYIQAIIDVNQMGILSSTGTWGANARLDKILTFLENRPLSSNGVPYVWYQSGNGNAYGSAVQEPYDTGALLVALNNLKTYRPDLTDTINYIVYNRTNYAPLEQQVDSFVTLYSLYDYYSVSGFASFWPSRFSTVVSSILNNILSRPTVLTYGVNLPTSCKLACEPLLLSVFNLSPNAELDNLAQLVYLAGEGRYAATNKFTAFSEGNTGLADPSYVYEFVVDWDGSTWVVDNAQFSTVGVVPIVYFKVAVGLLAMFDSGFTESMVSYVESKLPSPVYGYADGVDENGRVVSTVIDKTNSMIIQAAEHAISGSSSSAPTPSPTPTLPPSATPKPSNAPTSPSPSPTPTSGPTTSPTPTPTSTSTSNQSASPTAEPTDKAYSSSMLNSNTAPIQGQSSLSSSSPATPLPSDPSIPDTNGVQPIQPSAEPSPTGIQTVAKTVARPFYYTLIGVSFSVFVVSFVFLKKRH